MNPLSESRAVETEEFQPDSIGPRWRNRTLIILLSVMASTCHPTVQDASQPRAVVLVVLDTLRADFLGGYGNLEGWSPNLDRFAQSATVFEDMSSSSNNTLSTHEALFASKQPTFALQLARDETRDERHYSLPAHLNEASIKTAMFGHGPIFRVSATRDFSSTQKHEKARDGIQEAIDWITDETQTDEEFFVFLHLYDLHDPYYESLELISGDYFMDDRQERLSFQRELKAKGDEELRAAYGEGLQYLDYFLGELFDVFRDVSKERQLLVILTSDHGEAFAEHREYYYHTQYLYQEIVHVPLLVREYGSDSVPRVPFPTTSLDIAPTITGFFKTEHDSSLQGIDLRPLMEGEPPPERYIFAEGRNQRERMVRRDRYKLIQYQPPATEPTELFDLEADPGEQTNLLTSQPLVARELIGALKDYFESEARRLGLEVTLPERVDRELREALESIGYVDTR